jgi:Bacterial TniB protein
MKSLTLSKEDRIVQVEQTIKDAWIPYPAAMTISNILEDLYACNRQVRNGSMPYRKRNLLMIGDPNNGKTHILKHFCNLHPIEENRDKDAICASVISVEIDGPNRNDLYNSVLKDLNAPFRERDRVDVKQFQALELMRLAGTRILIIDELSTAITAGTLTQRAFLNTIKFLCNRSGVIIVGAGTKDVFSALRLVPQLDNRFRRVELKRRQFGDSFRRLLASYETILPLRKPSELQEPTMALKLYSMTEGYIGELADLLIEASKHAIKIEREQIDHRLLKEIDWESPSVRIRNR